MARLFLFFVVALALAWGVVWVADHPGQMSLVWGGWRIDTSAGVLGVALIVFAVTAALLYRFWLFLTRAPGRIGMAFKERRSQKGYKALTKGMVAVAAGDAEEAKRQVGKADSLLNEPPLTLLLKAQAAQLNGDEGAAETFFTLMLDDAEMEFLGLRGLLNQAMKRGDDKTALELARRAQGLNGKSAWLAETVFQLEARAGSWLGADEALKKVGKLTDFSAREVNHRRAVALLGQSVEAHKKGNTQDAIKLAQKALNEDPALVVASAHLARLLMAGDNARKAKDVIEKAWALAPHPDLLALYFDAAKATDGLKKVTAAQALLSLKSSSPYSHIAMAAAALEAQLWGQARTHLEAVLESSGGQAGGPLRTAMTLMARLEEEDCGDKDASRVWLARAAVAPADPAWLCGHCGHVDTQWTPHCPKCKTFDALAWANPPSAKPQDVLRLQS
ncbi:MAG: heme biosynthesis protein HemY [Rhodospirillales bacterium]|nr:heme biosynthesis protein HemY [Rhodospirillales bacterium]